MAEVNSPAQLQMVYDLWIFVHSGETEWWMHPEKARMNVCFADGHAKFIRYVDMWVPGPQAPWDWNHWNPRQPVNVEKPCSPTCAEEAARS